MWEHQHTIETPAAPHLVWRLYSDVTTWPRWNAAVADVRLDDPFAAGARGTLTPTGQGPLAFRVVEARENEGYTSETQIVDTVTLQLTTELTPLPTGGSRITHRAAFTGPAADYFGQSFGPVIAAGLPKAMEALSRLAQGLEVEAAR